MQSSKVSSLLSRHQTPVLEKLPVFLYLLGVWGIALQVCAMTCLAIISVIRIMKNSAGGASHNVSTDVALAVLFALFAVFLWVMLIQSVGTHSRTLGGLISCEVILLPIAYHLAQSHRLFLSAGLFLTICGVIPIVLWRENYRDFKKKSVAQRAGKWSKK